ncbi:MAG: apolipoprotein N-acyltransferase [Gemmatimonadales bacterium]
MALPRADWRLVIGGGILTFVAYPPFHFFIPTFLCLIPAVWLIEDGHMDERPWRRQVVQGFWYGLFAHGLILYWMVSALLPFTKLAVLGYLATIIVLALYVGLTFSVSGWIVRRTQLPLLFVFPIMWTAADWLIGHQGDIRFPWLGLGYSLTGFPTFVQIADVIGARGVTLLLAAANVALAMAWRRRATPKAVWVRVGGVAIGLVMLVAYGVVRERTLAVQPVANIGIIQPNVAANEKWDPRSRDEIFADLMRFSRGVLDSDDVDLLVWPEAAVPGYLYSRPLWEQSIHEIAAESATPMLVGGLDLDYRSQDDYDAYNAAFLFTPGVGDLTVYRKRYLVPITERVPFVDPNWFSGLEFFGGFGIGMEGTIFGAADHTFGVLICYESIFENLSRQLRRDGADFLLNITNDAWFGRTAAPYQHAAHLTLRAIENRVGIVRAANSGISAWIDPFGRFHEASDLYVEVTAVYPLTTGVAPPWFTRLGDWVGVLSVISAIGLVIWTRTRRPPPLRAG